MSISTEFDAIVVGSGPNGLAASIYLQSKGLSVLLIEGYKSVGGGLRTEELTLPGFKHDVCSSIHPMAAASPFFEDADLSSFGLELIYPSIAAAHPFDDGSAAILYNSLQATAASLGVDEALYTKIFARIANDWPKIAHDLLGPLSIPKNPLSYVQFGVKALLPADLFARVFKTKEAKALFMGMAAHSIQSLSKLTTSAIALVLMANAHRKGWPVIKGGSQSLADALVTRFLSMGGKLETGTYIKSLRQLPSAKAVLFDVTPRQLLEIAGHQFSTLYKWQLERYRYGMGVFKVDWALDAPIPFKNDLCGQASTIHLGGTHQQIIHSERQTAKGGYSEKPFILLAQQTSFDSTRAPEGKHTGWAYCHVPNGSQKDLTKVIEDSVESYAPGFKDRILARHTMNSIQMEEYNPNYIGGDIGGGTMDITQLFSRPALRWSPYRTSAKGLYICSSSTPPGAGVHGMCGYNAAKRAFKDIFQ